MLKDQVLTLLKGAQTPLSGEGMSRTLGVSRAAVWKAIEALRQEGYAISSAPNRGYRLDRSPDRVSPGELAGALAGGTLGRELVVLPSVDSTNDECKRRAVAGAPEGLVVIADRQTGGKGRRGRSFVSPAGQGLYLSVLLRPTCGLSELMWLTSWVAVAVCDGIEAACGVRPGIKWTNDIILQNKKLCGILTELGMEGESGQLQYAVVGVGVNLTQTETDFGPEVAPVAISLHQALGQAPRRSDLAAAILAALERMYRAFPARRQDYLDRYRRDCLTVGRAVTVIRGDSRENAVAEAVDDDFALLVRHPDGRRERLNAGEVSVRGLAGYV